MTTTQYTMKKTYLSSVRIDTLVPVPAMLLVASRSAGGYFEVIRDYTVIYNCNFHQAWEFLEADLSEYGLPPRYSTIDAFKRGKSYHHRRKR